MSESLGHDSSSPPAQKRMKLLDHYGSSESDAAQACSTITAAAEFRKYVELCDSCDGDQLSCLEFWAQHANSLPRLHDIALKALSVPLSTPATSASVERVFSSGGMFMRPSKSPTLQPHVVRPGLP